MSLQGHSYSLGKVMAIGGGSLGLEESKYLSPMLKKDKKEDPGNYWLISFTLVLGR